MITPISRRAFLAAAAARPRPNVVVLLTDDQRFDTIGALGNREVATPNLDRLVKGGVTFTHACTQGGMNGAICMPSRVQLLTGCNVFQAHRDVVDRQAQPEPSLKTVPELLRAQGYETCGVGKWHNGRVLYQRSFTHGGPIFFGGMTDQFKATVFDFGADKGRVAEKHTSELFTDGALRFLEARDRAKPFFLYVAYTSPHDPRTAPAAFASRYRAEQMKLPPNFLPEHPFDNGELKVRDELLAGFPRTPAEVQRHLADYYAMVSEVDHQIGRVLRAIDLRDTYVVMAGDNGLAVGQHGLMGKQNLYDHSWRVPLIVNGPGVKMNARDSRLCHLMDLAPTVLGWAGVEPSPALDGRPLFGGTERREVFGAYRQVQRALRTRDEKLIEYNVNGKRTAQLFSLRDDPWEMRNLASAKPARVAEMRARLQEMLREAGDPYRSAFA